MDKIDDLYRTLKGTSAAEAEVIVSKEWNPFLEELQILRSSKLEVSILNEVYRKVHQILTTLVMYEKLVEGFREKYYHLEWELEEIERLVN